MLVAYSVEDLKGVCRLLNRLFGLGLVILLLTGCKNSENIKEPLVSASSPVSEVGVSVEDSATAVENQPVYLHSVTFNDPDPLVAVKAECEMLTITEDSAIQSASEFNINIQAYNEAVVADNQIKIAYLDVSPNVWRFMAFRPSSNAKFQISLYQRDELISSTVKSISSGVAFTACARLEKISGAVGRYTAKWLAGNL